MLVISWKKAMTCLFTEWNRIMKKLITRLFDSAKVNCIFLIFSVYSSRSWWNQLIIFSWKRICSWIINKVVFFAIINFSNRVANGYKQHLWILLQPDISLAWWTVFWDEMKNFCLESFNASSMWVYLLMNWRFDTQIIFSQKQVISPEWKMLLEFEVTKKNFPIFS